METELVTIVVGLNGAIALALLLIAWRLWRLRRTLAQVNWMLDDVTRSTQGAIAGVQDSLISGQQGLQRLSGRYRLANRQLGQMRQLLLMLGWIQGYGTRRVRIERHRRLP
jgi:tRNA U54 and U55 pseudouridine synthase Pus10